MVAGLSRKGQGNDYFHVKKTLAKGATKDSKRRSYGNGRAHGLPVNCLPERRYILRPQWHASDISVYSDESGYQIPEPKPVGVDLILEGFSCLCFGSSYEKPKKVYTRKKETRRLLGPISQSNKRVVYPIASYGGRLNSKRLIEQRRRSLPHNYFRPVPNSKI